MSDPVIATTKQVGSASPTLFTAVRRIENQGPSNVFVGDSTVTDTTGWPLRTGENIVFTSMTDVYVIAGSGNSVPVTALNR